MVMGVIFGAHQDARSRTDVWGRDLHITPVILRNKGFPSDSLHGKRDHDQTRLPLPSSSPSRP